MTINKMLVFVLASLGISCGPAHDPDSRAQIKDTKLSYYGGPVLSNVRVYAVYWGENVNFEVRYTMADFYRALVEGPYMDWLSEYSTIGIAAVGGRAGANQAIQRGQYVGEINLHPFNQSLRIKDSEIRTELEAQIAAGNIPQPDSNTLMMIDMGPEMTVVYDRRIGSPNSNLYSCSDFCSYHSSYPRGNHQYLAYSVIMDFYESDCVDKCGPNGGFTEVTTSTSHELVEALTDPLGDESTLADGTSSVGWFWAGQKNNEGEIADLCVDAPNGHIFSTSGRSYVIQSEWSNKLNRCYSGP